MWKGELSCTRDLVVPFISQKSEKSTRQTRKIRGEGLARPFILFLSGPDFSRDVLGKFYG
jgi:hypothetical protein